MKAFVFVATVLGMAVATLHAGTTNEAFASSYAAGSEIARRVASSLEDENLHVAALQVVSAEGVVIVLGDTTDPRARNRISALLEELGLKRVANMVRLNVRRADAEVLRSAERALLLDPDLGGAARFGLSISDGVVAVSGVSSTALRQLVTDRLSRGEGVVSGITTSSVRPSYVSR